MSLSRGKQAVELARALADGRLSEAETTAPAREFQDEGLLEAFREISKLQAFHRESAAQGAEPGGGDWGNFRILDKLGEGAFGAVYLARDVKLGREVALKLLREHRADERASNTALVQEGAHLARISHPNVATVYGADEHEGRVGIWMEYIRGKSLKQMLNEQGPMSEREAALVVLDVCRALAAVHRAGLLHRDVKAENVIREEGGRFVLADFGVGMRVDRALFASPAGTPLYLAPEVLEGHAPSVRADIYSMGVLLFYLVTKQFPIEAEDLDGLRDAHRKHDMQLLRDVRPGLSPAFLRVVDHALEPDPRKRIATAGQMERALMDAIGLAGMAVETPETEDVESATPVLRTLVVTHLFKIPDTDAEEGVPPLTDPTPRHDRQVRELVERIGGRAVVREGRLLVLFERPIDAVLFALDYHELLRSNFSDRSPRLEASLGIHVGEVFLRRDGPGPSDASRERTRFAAEGVALPVVTAIASLGLPGQILLSRSAFDIARAADANAEPPSLDGASLTWLAHGAYVMSGLTDPVEVFEVGISGISPLRPPVDTATARRSVSVGDEATLGWRPGIGLPIPARPNWKLVKKLGDGAVGEVWLAEQAETDERRVFKFCFEPERVRALKREAALFRVLKIGLGARSDIARVIDWNFDEAPYFLESEYSGGGDLLSWAEAQGGIDRVPIETRLELAAQVGEAVAAAHSVGVLHKDIKPTNVLIREHESGPNVQLADFGIGLLTDDSIIRDQGITRLGFTDVNPLADDSKAGTRLYIAPEILEGKPPTVQSDIYALGVLLYQLVAGDLRKALSPSWPREIADELIAEDLAELLDGRPEKRPRSALEFANRLRTLDQRRRAREELRLASEEAERAKQALAVARRRRRLALGFMGVLLVVIGLVAFQERRTALEAERANREAAIARRVSSLLESVFQGSDPADGPGRDVTARELLDRGAERIRGDGSLAPEIRSRLLATIGGVYRSLGLYEQARDVLDEAAESASSLDANESDAVGRLHHELGLLAREEGDLSKAEHHHRLSLELRRRSLGERDIEVVSSLEELAYDLMLRGEVQPARELLEEALELRKSVEPVPSRELAVAMDGLSTLLAEISADSPGSLERLRSLELARGALDLRRELFGEDHVEVAWSLNNLAFRLQREGDHAEAEWMYREALRIKRQALGARHPSVATTESNLAQLLLELGSIDEATALAQDAVSIREQHFSAGHWRIALARSVLGSCLATRADSLEQAETLLREGYDVLRRERGPTAIVTVEAKSRLKRFYEDNGRTDEARRLDEEAPR